MITGFNTDVEHGDRVFHVQTEEKGPANPVVVTLVYCGGEILAALEVPYAADAPSTDQIRERMREQHRGLIRDVHAGKYDSQPQPLGHDGSTERSLDELVLESLDRSIDEARTSQSRAAHTARVLVRLERMLSAAERAEASAITTVEPARPTAPVEPVQDTIERALAAPSPWSSPSPALLPRPRRARFALAALIVLGTSAWIVLVVGPALPRPARVDLAAPPPAAPALELASPLLAFTLETPPLAARPSAIEIAPAAAAAPAADPAPARVSRAEEQEQEQETRRRASAAHPVRQARPTEPQAIAAVPRPELGAERAPAAAVPEAAEARPVEPTVENGDPIDLAAVDVRPLVRRRDLPRYTARARRAGLEGTVELALLIDEHGAVADVTLLHDGAGEELVLESLATVREWTFSPARKDRRPVKVWQEVAIDFTILPNRSTSVRIRE
jgi:TonB family protein